MIDDTALDLDGLTSLVIQKKKTYYDNHAIFCRKIQEPFKCVANMTLYSMYVPH